MKNITMCFAILVFFGALFGQPIYYDAAHTTPCNVPPFLSGTVTPNVLMVLDNSWSMMFSPWGEESSYWTCDDGTQYYGYADLDSHYQYNTSSLCYEVVQDWTGRADFASTNWRFEGNVLNCITMRRGDVLRKVMTGGRIKNKTYASGERLIYELEGGGNEETSRYWNKVFIKGDNNYYYLLTVKHNSKQVTWKKYSAWRSPITSGPSGSYSSSGTKYFSASFAIRSNYKTNDRPEGVLQQIYDRVKLGFMHYNTTNEGGCLNYACGTATVDSMYNTIRNMNFETNTPLTETFYESSFYFRGKSTGYYNVSTPDFYTYRYSRSNSKAVYSNIDPIDGWCQKNFVILCTDGEPYSDKTFPSSSSGWDSGIPLDADGDGYDPCPPTSIYPGYDCTYATHYLDDIAYWLHTTDLRSDFTNKQTITTYAVFLFSEDDNAVKLLNETGKKGSFDDKNNNNRPDLTEEYDVDGNGVADGFFMASNGYLLEQALTSVFVNLLRRAASSSAVSVVSNTSKGQGVVYQGFFQPAKFVGSTQLLWIGNIHSLWIDPYGNLREDTDQNSYLDMKKDYIVRVYFDGALNKTMISQFKDNDGNGTADEDKGIVDLDVVKSVWRAGEVMLARTAASRTMKTVMPCAVYDLANATFIGDGDPKTQGFKDFTTLNAADLRQFIDVSTTARAETVINYTRGIDYMLDSYRSRSQGTNVWKLGDIINSSPTFVGPPADRYDIIFNDASYRAFFNKWKSRKGVLYVGANDGQVHAFNAGNYIEQQNGSTLGQLKNNSNTLGTELWSVVPFSSLPQLKWQIDPNYCHVYSVDLTPRAFDVRMFAADATHTQGWGTILVCGMRFGNEPYLTPSLTSTYLKSAYRTTLTLKSSYLVLDVTDPDAPTPMFEFYDPNLQFTTAQPGVAKVYDTDYLKQWYILFGSGPSNTQGLSSIRPWFYAVGANRMNKWQLPDNNAHCGDVVTIDKDFDALTDVIYVGASVYDNSLGRWVGRIYRITTNESSDFTKWSVTTLLYLPAAVTAGVAVTTDDYGNIWVFAGTGRYFSQRDRDEQNYTQYMVGIKDPISESSTDSVRWGNLFDVSSRTVQTTDSGTYVYSGTSGIKYDSLKVLINSKSGWKKALPVTGERVINTPILIGGALFFTTFVPSTDICAFGGSSRLYGIDFLTGLPGETSILGLSSTGWLYDYVSIGEGVPSAPAAHVGLTDDATIAVQLSTGTITQTRASINSPKSGALFWRGR